jgi:hypothetical protein
MPKGIRRNEPPTCHPEMPHHAMGLCLNCYRTKYNKNYSKRSAFISRRDRLARQGWTEEKVGKVRLEQENSCAICKSKFNSTPYADHEHINPPKPRGLLCIYCNLALGQFKDSIDIVESAARYLRKWK